MNIENEAELREYLVASHRIAPEEPFQARVLKGGVSSRTVLVRFAERPAWVLKQALPKLRVRMDWYSDPQRVHREALGLRHLQSLLPDGSVPGFLFEDFSCQLLAMEAVPEPHANWKTMLLSGDIQEDHVDQFAILLASLHRNGWLRREELRELFADWTYFESLRVEPYYLCSAQQAPDAKPFLTELVETTRQRRLTLVHGDFSPKNILVHQGRLVLLDHEVIHFGDPAFDLGFGLTHLLSKAHHCRAEREKFGGAAARFWVRYLERLGDAPWRVDLEFHAVRHTLGCLLARTVGRSPLEYFSTGELTRQREAVLAIMNKPPQNMSQLQSEFLHRLEPGCP